MPFATDCPDRLRRQIAFIVEVDKLKHVLRRSVLPNTSRRENDAEHSWHMALTAMLFEEYVNDRDVDILRVIKMALVHDLVEIDAGDTYAYDDLGYQDKETRERAAADRIFSMLPDDQAAGLRGLWEEFEAMETVDARYAAAVDRFQPLLLNYLTHGEVWLNNSITRDQVIRRMRPIEHITPGLWPAVMHLIDISAEKGYLKPGTED